MKWFPNACSGSNAVLTGHSVRDLFRCLCSDKIGINSVFPIQTKTFLIITNPLKTAESPQHEYLPAKPLLSTGQLPPSCAEDSQDYFPPRGPWIVSFLTDHLWNSFSLTWRNFPAFWVYNQFTPLYSGRHSSPWCVTCHPSGRSTWEDFESKLSEQGMCVLMKSEFLAA